MPTKLFGHSSSAKDNELAVNVGQILIELSKLSWNFHNGRVTSEERKRTGQRTESVRQLSCNYIFMSSKKSTGHLKGFKHFTIFASSYCIASNNIVINFKSL